ncbi:MAG: hypothetical protein ACKVI5_04705 [Nitrospinaceae bacterium]|jgi:hypothetical protein|tara:strand:+ start:548 stop:721 length:174 start_codon:yes stop_codon:yes gene_type:complete
MFYQVKILNKKGKLINLLTTESLSKRHWSLFEEQLKPNTKKKNSFNDFNKIKKLALI